MQQMIQISCLKLLVTPAVPPTPLIDLSAPKTERHDAFGTTSEFLQLLDSTLGKLSQISGNLEMSQVFRVQSHGDDK